MSREKFEEWYDTTHKFNGIDGWAAQKSLHYGIWLAGRESMRDEAIDKLGDFDATKCAQIVAGIEP